MDEAKPQVIVIAGPNGAGKSTLAPFLLRDSLDLQDYVNADPIALGLSGFNPSSVAFKAGRVMMNRLHDLGRERKSFAFENVWSVYDNSDPSEPISIASGGRDRTMAILQSDAWTEFSERRYDQADEAKAN